MDLFRRLAQHDFGEVHVRHDARTGLAALVAIHDTRLGPALGGCRFLPYASDEAALVDALRLARGMTYKAALARLRLGGGKSVLLRPAGEFDRTALFRAFGRFVEDLGGRYITAEDSGTGLADMEVIRTQTRHVTGIDPAHGGSGDPSPFTALGVRRGIEACVRWQLGRASLDGVRVAVQGVGHVGYALCRELAALGAVLVIADIDAERSARAAAELGARAVDVADIARVPCDVFAPCALGAGLNDGTIPALQATIVAGAANNQLAEPRHGQALAARGILYAPDYALNAGGLINVAHEVGGYDAAAARAQTLAIYDTIWEICERSRATGRPTAEVADLLAEERLAAAGPR